MTNESTIGLIKQRLEILYQMVQVLEAEGGGGSVDAYTKAQTDALLATKADASTTYSKTETNTLLEGKADTSTTYTKTQTDTEITNAIGALDVETTATSGSYIKSISEADGKISAVAETIDTTPTENSTHPITSGAVYTAIQNAGGGGTDLTPTNVGAKASTFPEEYMSILEKHLPFTTGQAVSNYSGTTWIFYAEDSTYYYYIENFIYANSLTSALYYRFASIKKSDRTWTQQDTNAITRVITDNNYTDIMLRGKSTISSSQNLDNISYGIFFCPDTTSVINSPTTNPFFIEQYSVSYKSGLTTKHYDKQVLTDFTTNDIYYRNYNNGTWSSWYKISATVVS